jgi:peptidoglycan hydrolase-like protein with peptidoglycan-binding domain
MTKTTTVASKAFVAVVAAAMVFSLVAPAAKAATAEELQAQITALMAQITALQGGTTATTPATGAAMADKFTFTRALTLGSTGADVTALQNHLIKNGYAIAAGATGYFGEQTRSAVAAWQTAVGITPAAGYFGPVSQAKYAASMAATTPTTPGTGTTTDDGDDTDSADLGSDEGTIDTFDEVSSADSNINEGEIGEVFAFTAEIEGDVMVDRVDFYMDTAASSDSADDYFQGAMLMVDGEEVGSIDVDDFDEDSYNEVTTGTGDEYRLRFTGLDLVFVDGDEPEFTLAFEANSSIDSGDLSTDWSVELADDSVRYTDGKGFSESTGADIVEPFGFDAEEVAELDITESNDNPDAATLEVDDEDDSEELTVLAFEIEEKNGLDVTIEDMTVTVTTLGTTDESVVVAEAKLFNGAEELGSESVPNGGVVLFENLGLEIGADETAELEVKLVFAGAEDYAEGDQVSAAFTSIDDAEDENGNDEGDMSISGSADGKVHTLRSTGISVEIVSAETEVNTEDGANNDSVDFTWEVEITAFGNDTVYINKDFADVVSSGAATDLDQIYAVTVSAGAALTGVSGTITSDADDVNGDDTAYGAVYNGETFYKISSGNSETFTIVVSGTNQTDTKQVRAALSNIEWTTDLVTSATAENGSTATFSSYTDNLADDSETPFKSIN